VVFYVSVLKTFFLCTLQPCVDIEHGCRFLGFCVDIELLLFTVC